MQTQPEFAAAAQSNPTRFAELLAQTRERTMTAELQRQREIEHLNADPFDVEAQRRYRGDDTPTSRHGEYGARARVFAGELWAGDDALHSGRGKFTTSNGVRGQRSATDHHEPRMRRSLRHYAPPRPALFGHRTRRRYCQNPGPGAQRAAQARGLAPSVLDPHHGGPRRRPPSRARHAEGAPGVHRSTKECAPHTGEGSQILVGA
ncbi:hypothetical protein B0H16DRAFT_1017467 [Mycena metata]|uniref:Uncharacterized protein n=1 Tax=Mycena metata TaxID=1033252 RepID=A0AAD7N3Q7_9AGAR|nr:hypothetical protein B0H16DRAFT_1017467 [Mycena metata]